MMDFPSTACSPRLTVMLEPNWLATSTKHIAGRAWSPSLLTIVTLMLIRSGKSPEGGLMQSQVPNAPSFWLTYVDVDDVKAATARAVSLGGRVMKDVTEVPGMGSFTIITDPTGAALGLWQTAK